MTEDLRRLEDRKTARDRINKRYLEMAALEGVSLVCQWDDPETHLLCVGLRGCLCTCHDHEAS